MRTRFRKPLLYPLSYGGATQKGIAAAVVQFAGALSSAAESPASR
jgi:hypothetical protein